jgi:acetyl-CoA carboxylase/biotin carboxylase 1
MRAAAQVYSTNLGQVVDIVVSHQAVPLKAALVARLMAALVLPAPEHYRPLLRRLAALGAALRAPARSALAARACHACRLTDVRVAPRSACERPRARAGNGSAEVAHRAQQLLEHSLLSELRAVVARALSGLDMFAGGQLSELDLLGSDLLENAERDVRPAPHGGRASACCA